MIEKTLARKTPSGEFQVTTPKESNNKKKWLQVQNILPYRPISKYSPTKEPANLAKLQSSIGLDLMEDFSFARISS